MMERARVQPAAAKKRRSLRRAFIFSLGGIVGVAVLAAVTLYVSGRGRLSAAIEDVRKSGGKMPPTVEELERAEHEVPAWANALPDHLPFGASISGEKFEEELERARQGGTSDETLRALEQWDSYRKRMEDSPFIEQLGEALRDSTIDLPPELASAARVIALWESAAVPVRNLCEADSQETGRTPPPYIRVLEAIAYRGTKRFACWFLLGEEQRAMEALEQALCSCRLALSGSIGWTTSELVVQAISGVLSHGSDTLDWELVRRRLALLPSPMTTLRADIERTRVEALDLALRCDAAEAELEYLDLDLAVWRALLFARHECATWIRELGRLHEYIRPPYAECLHAVQREAGKDHYGTFKRVGVFLEWADFVGETLTLEAQRDLVDLGLLARIEGVEEALRQVEESQDPFTGHPYRTRLEDDGTLVLWSVGPDEFDDGGTCAPLTLWHEPGPDFVVRVRAAGR